VDEEGDRFKIREETEVEVVRSRPLGKFSKDWACAACSRMKSIGQTWKLGASQRWAKDLLIELDETPAGTFVELEGPPRRSTKQLPRWLFKKRLSAEKLSGAICRRVQAPWCRSGKHAVHFWKNEVSHDVICQKNDKKFA